ncbi:MAG: helix-turn-helix transcriptional regulator [Clostridia bacterium]
MRDSVSGGALTEATFFILLSVYSAKHGYAIRQFVEDRTSGRLLLGAGTLYGALTALQEKCWIVRSKSELMHRKEYQITEQGKAIVKKELCRLKGIVRMADSIIKTEVPN